ncbi:hypothetical protein MLD38_027199 [Melastoma candidum]|nr:hypothetical protein MLD38_027199 [Melastoma candidum]
MPLRLQPDMPVPLRPPLKVCSPDVCSQNLNPFRKIASSVLDFVEDAVLSPFEKTRDLPKTVDPVFQLAGNFSPVQECPVQHRLEVVGQIPHCLRGGAYLRNGANPLFPPSSRGHHLFDGDGMIHAVTFGSQGQASYCCRYTRTSRLEQEAALGRPVFPKPIGELHGRYGFARLGLFMARTSIGLVDDSHGAGTANAGLVYFNGRLLAMSEDDLPYHVKVDADGDLKTIGRFDFDKQLDRQMIAHPKVDPATGDLHALSYDVLRKPYLKYFRFNRHGQRTCQLDISLELPTMIHDFAITEDHVIIPDHQVVFRLSEMIRGGSPVIFDQTKTSRFMILPKDMHDQSAIQRIDVPDCFCFHLWNAWEEKDERGNTVVINILGSCMDPPGSIFNEYDQNGSAPRIELTKIRINLRSGQVERRPLAQGLNLEAGQVDRKFLGRETRYVYLAIAEPWPKCRGIAKVDLLTGEVTEFSYGRGSYGGEPCYINATCEGSPSSDCGDYLVSYVRDEGREESELVIVRASDMQQVGLVRLPARVPYGFHGIFLRPEELRNQVVCC